MRAGLAHEVEVRVESYILVRQQRDALSRLALPGAAASGCSDEVATMGLRGHSGQARSCKGKSQSSGPGSRRCVACPLAPGRHAADGLEAAQAEEASAMARRMVQVYADFATDVAAMPVLVGARPVHKRAACVALAHILCHIMWGWCLGGGSRVSGCASPCARVPALAAYPLSAAHWPQGVAAPRPRSVPQPRSLPACVTVHGPRCGAAGQPGWGCAGRKSRLESFAGANLTLTIEAMMGDRKALQARRAPRGQALSPG